MDRHFLNDIVRKFPVGPTFRIMRLDGGITNDTFKVTTGRYTYVLQQLHGIFRPTVLEDTHAITMHLDRNGFKTPRLIPARTGELGVVRNGGCWRMLTYVPGRCTQEALTPEQCRSAGELAGRFHATVNQFRYRFRHRMPHFHDTPEKMCQLRRARAEFIEQRAFRPLVPLADEVLKAYVRVRGKLRGLPDRIVHGDLKASNIRFDRSGKQAVSLLDLDTIGRHKLAVDMGDATRSWCNRAREGDYRHARFNLRNFKGMLRGYLTGVGGFITRKEFGSFLVGTETIILELSARFITDAFRQEYFKLEKGRYDDLYEQNLVRARSQTRLFRDFAGKRERARNVLRQVWRDYNGK